MMGNTAMSAAPIAAAVCTASDADGCQRFVSDAITTAKNIAAQVKGSSANGPTA